MNVTIRTKVSTVYSGRMSDGSFGVVAETRSGRRFQLDHEFPTIQRASAFAEKVGARGSIEECHWIELDPIYGTAAWVAKRAEAASYSIGLREGYVTDINQVPEDLRAYL